MQLTGVANEPSNKSGERENDSLPFSLSLFPFVRLISAGGCIIAPLIAG